jgi:hypothetical protein
MKIRNKIVEKTVSCFRRNLITKVRSTMAVCRIIIAIRSTKVKSMSPCQTASVELTL